MVPVSHFRGPTWTYSWFLMLSKGDWIDFKIDPCLLVRCCPFYFKLEVNEYCL